MLIYLVAALQSLVYLASIPVCGAVCLSAGEGLRLGVGLSLFERRFALRRAWRLDANPSRRSKGRGSRLGWRVLLRLRGLGLGLRGSLCLGDAAATAMACGALRALAAALGGRAQRMEIAIVPEFSANEIHVELQGMIRASAGQIITAAAQCGIDDIHRRIAQWTDIPSKAS